MDKKSLLIAVIGYLLIAVNATVDLSCQVQRTISQPVTGEQCPDNSVLRLCTSEVIMCTCLGQGNLLEWGNSLFTDVLTFSNTGGTTAGAEDSDAATGATAVVTAVNPSDNITSNLTLSVTTTAAVNASQFNNTAIGCQDASGPSGEMEQTIFVFAPPPIPNITAISFTADTSFTVEWNETLRGCEMVDHFDPQISPNDLSCTMSDMTYTCSYNETHLGHMYTFTVSALNCGTQTSQEASEPLNLAVPDQANLTAIPLYDSSGCLLEIKSWATEVSQVSIANGVDNSNEYIFTYDNGSKPLQFMQPCCQHTFTVNDSSQVQPYDVTVAVRNVVGIGTASAPEMIESRNNVVDVIVDTLVREVICQFERGPFTSANCTIEYGTDPTYMNLPNTASSNGTNVINVTIPLDEPLQRNTTYYYIVTTMGVQIQGTFRTACLPEELGVTVDTTPDSNCSESSVGSVQIRNGTGCYNGSDIGSVATYSCSCWFSLEGSERRVCLPDGLWSGTTPRCLTNCSQIPPPPTVNGGVLVRNDSCILLEYNCPNVAFGAMSGTLRYDCDSGNWTTDPLVPCSGAANSAIAIIIVIAALVAVDIITIIIYIILKNKNKGLVIAMIVFLCLTVIGIPLAIVIAVWYFKKTDKGGTTGDDTPRGAGVTCCVIVTIILLCLSVIWIPLAIMVAVWYFRKTTGDTEETDRSPGEIKLKDVDTKREEEQYSTLQHGKPPTSPDPLLPDPNYGRLGEHSEEAGDLYSQTRHGDIPHAVPNPDDQTYSHLKGGEGGGGGEEYSHIQRGKPARAIPNPNDPNYSRLKQGQGASRPSAEELGGMYDEVGEGVRYKPSQKEEKEGKGKRKRQK